MLRRSLLATLVTLPLVASCASGGGSSGSGQKPGARYVDLATPISQRGNLSKLWELIQLAQFEDKLRGTGPLTFFAPNNQALEGMEGGALDRLMRRTNRGKLREMLDNHLANARLSAEDLRRAKSIYMANGREIIATRRGQDWRVGTAKVVVADIDGGNGFVQVIDEPLFVPQI